MSFEGKEMRVAEVKEKSGPLQIVKRPIPKPGPGQVLIKVESCGVCHTDAMIVDGHMGGSFPLVPGHEAVGRVVQIGDNVKSLALNQRVVFGFFGQFCHSCDSCRRGDTPICRNPSIYGVGIEGGFAEYAVAFEDVLVRVPDGIPSEEAAPMMCAGVTVFNAIRNSNAKAGDLVAVQGIGGLGHLAVQFCKRMGFVTAAISGGSDKKELATQLGADLYFDYKQVNVAAELLKIGGAKAIVATSTDAQSISDLIPGLSTNGTLLVVGLPNGPISVRASDLILGRRQILGWPGGKPTDVEDTIKFALQTGVKSVVEKFPLDKADEAYKHMLSNKARFRVVIVMDQ